MTESSNKKSYYELNKGRLQAYQRWYYHKTKNKNKNIKVEDEEFKPKKIKGFKKTVGKVTVYFD